MIVAKLFLIALCLKFAFSKEKVLKFQSVQCDFSSDHVMPNVTCESRDDGKNSMMTILVNFKKPMTTVNVVFKKLLKI